MLTYNELIELRDKLVHGEIQLELAKAQYWDGSKRNNALGIQKTGKKED